MAQKESALFTFTPGSLSGLAVIFLLFAVFFALLNGQKVKALRANAAMPRTAVPAKVNALTNGTFGAQQHGKTADTEDRVAKAEAARTQAEKEKREIKVAKFPWGASGRALTIDRTEGMTKLILDPVTERVLGVGIVGAGAGELIAEGTLAIEMSALAKDVALTIHPHPTLSETVMQSAEVFFGTSTDLYRPKK